MMHEPVAVVGAWLKRVVEGYYRYHAVRATCLCFRGSENGFAVIGGMFYAGAVNGGSQTGIACGLSSIGGFLVPALFIHIPMFALTLVSEGGAVCGNSARTDLCGGWSAMVIPTATPSADSGAGPG